MFREGAVFNFSKKNKNLVCLCSSFRYMYVNLLYFKPWSCSDVKGINKRLSNLYDGEKVIKKGIIEVGQVYLSRLKKKVTGPRCFPGRV